jgi:putative ABC transport system permease protein
MNTFSIALRAILTNKTRSLLTMLGVIIGVGSVILLTSIGTGLQNYIEAQFEDLGSNTVVIYPTQIFTEGGGFNNNDGGFINSKQFDLEMVKDISRMREFAQYVLPETQNTGTITYKGNSEKGTLVGTTVDYEKVRNTKAEKGRFFTEEEDRSGQRVMVMGPKLAEKVFGRVDPVNKEVRLNDVAFRVVGVTEEKGGGFGGPSFDEFIIIPLEAYFRMFDSRDINAVSIQVRDKSQIEQSIAELKTYMRDVQNRKDDEFDVFDQRQILNTINQILGMLTLGLGGIAAISLVVGGIGIMNIMLVSVTERTREIGLRKAIGATPRQILVQFLIESALLSFIGGAIGIGLASVLSFLIRILADFPSAITLESILLAFGVSVAVGVIFGVAPARKASKLSPIEALRSE